MNKVNEWTLHFLGNYRRKEKTLDDLHTPLIDIRKAIYE